MEGTPMGTPQGGAGAPTVDPVEVLTEVVPRLYRVLRAALDEDPALPSLEQLRVMTRIDAGVHHRGRRRRRAASLWGERAGKRFERALDRRLPVGLLL